MVFMPSTRPRSRAGCAGTPPSAGSPAAARWRRAAGSGGGSPPSRGPPLADVHQLVAKSTASAAAPARTGSATRSWWPLPRAHRAADPEPVPVAPLRSTAAQCPSGPVPRLEQPGGQRLAVAGGAGVVGAEQLEQVDELLAGLVVVLHPVEERVEAGARSSSSAPSIAGAGQRAPPGGSRPSRGCAPAARAPRRCRPVDEQLGQRRRPPARGRGRARAPGAATPRRRRRRSRSTSVSSSVGSRRSTNSLDDRPRAGRRRSRRRPCRPCSAYTAGMPCTWNACETCGFSSTLTLASSTLPVGVGDDLLEDRAERAARAAPRGPQVDHDGHLVGALEDVGLERGIGDVDHAVTLPVTQGRPDLIRRHRRADTWPHRQRGRPMSTGDVEGIDVAKVTAWFEANVDGVEPPLTFDLIAGGRSNLTFRVTDAAGARLGAAPPAARPRARHRPRHGPGAPHHLRARPDRRPGPARPRALRRRRRSTARPSTSWASSTATSSATRRRPRRFTPEQRRARRRLARRRAGRIHAVDPDAVGLGDLGRKEGYIERQLKRWYGQWEKSKTRELPAVDEVHDRLQASIPEQGTAAIVHGDYRLDNCMVGDDGDRGRGARLGDLHARRPARRRRPADGLLGRARRRACRACPAAPTTLDGFPPPRRAARALRRRSAGATSPTSTSTWRSATGSWPASSRACTPATSAARWATTATGFEVFARAGRAPARRSGRAATDRMAV